MSTTEVSRVSQGTTMLETPEQQRHQRGKGKHHDEVVHRHLRQGEVGIAAGEATPDKHHGGAGCRASKMRPAT